MFNHGNLSLLIVMYMWKQYLMQQDVFMNCYYELLNER